MNGRVKLPFFCLLGGVGAAFMMVPILEDWPKVIAVCLTATVYGSTGYIIRRVVKRGQWYSGVLTSVPLWLLVYFWGLEEVSASGLALAFALVFAYAGSWAGGRAAFHENTVSPSDPGHHRAYSERGRAE